MCLQLRLVKYGDTIVHNHNKDVHDTHETVKYMSASVGVTVGTRETQSNRDAARTGLAVRLVKCGDTIFHNHSKDACDTA